MAAWMKGALALVALGAVVGVALWLGGEDAPAGSAPVVAGDAPARSKTMQAPEGAEPDAPRLQSGDVEPIAVETPAPATDAGTAAAEVAPRPKVTLTGRVADVSGRAVRGARVVFHEAAGPRLLRLGDDDEEDAEPAAPPETRTDAQGRFELTVDVPDEEQRDDDMPVVLRSRPQVAAVHEAYATLVHDVPGLVEGTTDLGVLVVQPGTQLVGRVVDDAGRALAGARVTGHHLSDQGRSGGFVRFLSGRVTEQYNADVTGPDGRFLVTGLPAGRAELVAEADGRQVGVRGDLELAEGESLDVGDIALPAGAAIAGFVMDADGAPVEGAVVTVSSMARIVVRRMEDMPRQQLGREMRLRAETDADGWFELLGLGEGQYTVHVTADGFARSSTENVPTGTRDLSVRLAVLGELIVTLRDGADRSPITGADVHAEPRADGPFMMFGESLEVEESESVPGEYVVRGAGPSGTKLIVAAEGFAALEVDGPSVPEGGSERFTVDLVPESVVAGRVVDEAGNGIADARVRLTEYVPPEPAHGGRFEFRRDVRRRIGGGEDSDPMQEATRAVTADDGTFVMRGVPAGDWELTARAEDFVASDARVISLDQGESQDDLVVELAVGGAVVGRVVEEDGTPVASVSVIVRPAAPAGGTGHDAHGRIEAMFGGGPDGPQRGTTAADGTFEVRSLPPGPYEVEIGSQRGMSMGGAMVFIGDSVQGSGDESQVRRVTVLAGEEVFVELVQPPTATLEGRVLAGGEPVEVTLVSLKAAGSFLPFGGQQVETDRYGRFTFENVEPGEYEVSTVVPGAALPETAEVKLEGGRTSEADLVFSGATLRGRVVDKTTEQGARDVTIVVTPVQETGQAQQETAISLVMVGSRGGGGSGMSMEFGGGSQSKVRTDANGDFEVRFLEPGTYTVEALGGAYIGGEVGPVEVKEGATLDDVRIEVERGATLTGIVVSGDTGQPLQGAPVSLSGPGMREMSMTENGRFTFEGLGAGDYTVEVMGSGFGGQPVASQAVSLETGEYREVDLTTGD